MRVYELARELGVPSKVLLARLSALGIEAKSHSSSIEDDAVAKLRHAFGVAERPVEKKKRRIRVIKKQKVEARAEKEKAEAPAKKKVKKKAKAAKKVKKKAAAEKVEAPPAQVEAAAAEAPAEAPAPEKPLAPEVAEETPAQAEAAPPEKVVSSPEPARESHIPPPPPPDARGKPIKFRRVERKGAGKAPPRATGPDAAAAKKKVEKKAGKPEKKADRKGRGKEEPKRTERPAAAPSSRAKVREFTPSETPPKGDRQRPARRKGTAKRGRQARYEESHFDVGRRKKKASAKPATIAPKERKAVQVSEACTVAELAQALGVRAGDVIALLMGKGVFATINERLSRDSIEALSEEMGRRVEVQSANEEELIADLLAEDEKKTPRAPVVTVMGHVDHGKTSLLDRIRETDVVAGETGGITQHIAAWDVETPGGRVVFLDTPGHSAFTAMRARGAQVTDVVVLVVAADDGVMPQTIEAIDHIKAAEAPVVVAVNKIDLPGANPDRVKQELMQHGIIAEEFGGSVQCVPVSAKTGEGIDGLLELLVLETELLDLRANPDRAAIGSVVEARVDRRRGNVATVLVQQGTLRVGDTVVCGIASGRVRALLDDAGNVVEEAGPSTPVEVLGLDGVPHSGDVLRAVDNERAARDLVVRRQESERMRATIRKRITLEDLHEQVAGGEIQEFNLIIKGDVQGSVEALADSLRELGTEEVAVRIVHGGAGNVNESDINLASVTDAVVVGLHVGVEPNVESVAKTEGVEVRLYDLIYEAIGEVRDALEGMLKPEIKRVRQGRAEVRQVFRVSTGVVAGCLLAEGRARRDDRASLMRGNEEIYDGKLASLRRFKDDVREVTSGLECGIQLDGFDNVEVGDEIVLYVVEEQKRTL